MSFEPAIRRGRFWDDANALNKRIVEYPFHTSGKNERDFENGFASVLIATKKRF